ncbi:hypothetical protein Pint_31164 [Pistacia integerrima]|uniref:Uncharacterized protein n=1 Tax=Pistacia integerrima TaxID=434235 RepID=A0ACC0XKY4_9ROSI|nr:hypothetical protein Pint_31164 [Pistacia integerrima]
MIYDVLVDTLLLENQLPLFILEDLFDLAKREMHMGKFLLIEDKLFEEQFPKAQHFVDLIRLCFQPSEEICELKTLVAPTITELQQAGVKFKLGSSNHLFDLRFNDGTLEIPKLTIVDRTKALFRNLHDFEALNSVTNYVNDYIRIMNYLVSGPKDVKVLVQNGIIENLLSDSEDVSTLFQNLQKETGIDSDNFYYSGHIEDLKAYCTSPWHKWKATLKQNYFNTSWASISVIATVVLLILIIIQAVFYCHQQVDSTCTYICFAYISLVLLDC